VRLTAVALAIAGDFEDVVYSWRTQADQYPSDDSGIFVASGADTADTFGFRLG
jgi:cobalamin biosynthesis protein CobD/CbiB